MSNTVLRVKYHPAKKEINFKRFQAGKEIEVKANGVLGSYMKEKGHFVLQDHGNEFFDDIVKFFDGEKEIKLEVVTTQNDFEDLMQMTEYYNEQSEVKIDATFLAELPDMDKTYEMVKKHGRKSMEILNRHRNYFYDIPLDNDNVHKYVDLFAKEIKDVTCDIEKKIEKLDQNSVNLCFSGVHSSGKSTLINALLGYSILPEAILPETAAMFTIKSPQKGENIKVVFYILSDPAQIVWDDDNKCFNFIVGPSESEEREKIQKTMNAAKGKACYEQLHEILCNLNNNKDVSREINVFFPIPLDNDKVQFTIYDTPGTDSDNEQHQEILREALSEQTHSILIYVVYSKGLKGSGNRTLLEMLKTAEEKESKSTIDIGRSLFVVNAADDINGNKAYEDIIQAELANDTIGVNIKLADKKLFFTSAKYGYAARAKENGIATEQEDFYVMRQGPQILDEKFGCYYKHNRVATSEYATKVLKNKCDTELQIQSGNIYKQLWVASGLYALETEIRTYGEKYASAVKAYSIIDGVDKALARLDRNAESIRRQNDDNITDVNTEIEKIQGAILDTIEKAYSRRKLPQDGTLPKKTGEELWLNQDSIAEHIVNPVKEELSKILKIYFWEIGKKKFKDSDKSKIETMIQSKLNAYTDHFKNMYKTVLEENRDSFIKEIKTAIQQNGELSKEAKEYILEIDIPQVDEFRDSHEFGCLYENNKKTGMLLWRKEYVDCENLNRDIEAKLLKIVGELSMGYKENYKTALESLLSKVKSEFTFNMSSYSLQLRAKMEDRSAMEQLKNKIEEAAGELLECQNRLNELIWREVDYE